MTTVQYDQSPNAAVGGGEMTTTTALVRYEAARQALAEAVRVDDVKDIRDYAVAAAAYARQAKDVDMLNNAIEIRERAERRAGEILIEMRERGERDTGTGGDRRSQLHAATVKLADLGIDKTQSSRWQAKARLSDDEFEQHLDRVKRNAVAAATDPTIEINPRARKSNGPSSNKADHKPGSHAASASKRLPRSHTNDIALCNHTNRQMAAVEALTALQEAANESLSAVAVDPADIVVLWRDYAALDLIIDWLHKVRELAAVRYGV
jgi:hypothetical protein